MRVGGSKWYGGVATPELHPSRPWSQFSLLCFSRQSWVFGTCVLGREHPGCSPLLSTRPPFPVVRTIQGLKGCLPLPACSFFVYLPRALVNVLVYGAVEIEVFMFSCQTLSVLYYQTFSVITSFACRTLYICS